jgi:hypothetical protein
MPITRSSFLWSLLSLGATPFITFAEGLELNSNVLSPAAKKLEDSARLLMTRADSASISQMADSVLGYPHVVKIPSTPRELLKVRLSSAEAAHLQGDISGVHERDLASTLNRISDTLNLPKFALVSQRQLRVLRVRLLKSAPVFMGRGMTTPSAMVGDSINPYMSPLQAAHLALVTMDQKILNAHFQLEIDEWERQYEIERAARQQQIVSGTPNPSFKGLAINPNGKLLLRTINAAAESMDLQAGIQLMADVLSGLGI